MINNENNQNNAKNEGHHDHAEKTQTPKQIKKSQYRNLSIAMGCVALIVGGSYYGLEHSSSHNAHPHNSAVRFSNTIEDQSIYSASLEQFQSQILKDQKSTQTLKTQMAALKAEAAKGEKNKALQQKYDDVLQKMEGMEKEIKLLKSGQSTLNHAQNEGGNSSDGNVFPAIPNTSPYINNGPGHLTSAVAINGDDHLELVSKARPTYMPSTMTPNTYVPSGTYALGVLLQGADLIADSYDQENPKPVLIRLVSSGTMPNRRKSHLKGCSVIGAMTGDISSGRGDVRLERLSCVRPNGSIVDVAVYGTVSTNGKEGISGQTYSRENGRLFSAALSGSAAGISNGVSQGYLQYGNSLYGPTAQVSGGDLFKFGTAQGLSSGLNTLADYQMSRANQIHPIIEVNGGKYVVVTFLKGFYFDKDGAQQKLADQNPWAVQNAQTETRTQTTQNSDAALSSVP